ncbi:sulfur carrier protein ThiS [Chitinispirillales bacterium ANBcel5]|uniref:sulfur carrier protein ThiS n=1 Tax=Cellulosispirillum alkaliphilum TaxID=3039283 RepID=UPI002A509398|nr:sulfur carrier protein ThiS [Chitinispirillales bacterium ANBcel5]
MKISVNGESTSLDTPLSITQLLKTLDVEMPDMVSVQLNGEFLDRENFSSTMVKEGDEVDFLYFMGGGR